MTKKTYYIGDLGNVMSEETWLEIHSLVYPYKSPNENRAVDGRFSLKDGRFFDIFQTALGDGIYDYDIAVDSGSIGCIEQRWMDHQEDIGTGIIVEMEDDFVSYSIEGNIFIGPYNINTSILSWMKEGDLVK